MASPSAQVCTTVQPLLNQCESIEKVLLIITGAAQRVSLQDTRCRHSTIVTARMGAPSTRDPLRSSVLQRAKWAVAKCLAYPPD